MMEKLSVRQMQRKVSGGAFIISTIDSLRLPQLPAADAEAEGRKRVREVPASLCDYLLFEESPAR